MDMLNDQRKETQESMIQKADQITDPSNMIITAADTSFHAGIVGIVAGRLTEKYYKPSVILEINEET
jgi:single-stranded-DNA-specific exonuclease